MVAFYAEDASTGKTILFHFRWKGKSELGRRKKRMGGR
jgi:hypothetical protein